MKAGDPPRSSLLITVPFYDIYDPHIAGISLSRLQQESRDPLKEPLSSANQQLSKKGKGLGIVYVQDNHFEESQFQRNLNRIEGRKEFYPNIDAVVLYAKEEGIFPAPAQKDVRPVIRFLSRVWLREASIKEIPGLVEINTPLEAYMKSCPFEASKEDVQMLRQLYGQVGNVPGLGGP